MNTSTTFINSSYQDQKRKTSRLHYPVLRAAETPPAEQHHNTRLISKTIQRLKVQYLHSFFFFSIFSFLVQSPSVSSSEDDLRFYLSTVVGGTTEDDRDWICSAAKRRKEAWLPQLPSHQQGEDPFTLLPTIVDLEGLILICD